MISTIDDVYEKQFQQERWINNSKFLSIEKLKLNIPSFQYFLKEDKNLEYYCTEKVFKHVLTKKNLFESKNAKSLERGGIPCKYIREFLLKLFSIENIESSYLQKYQIVFKERDPNYLEDFVPYFTGYKTLQESLPIDFLNAEGIQKLKEILWMLNSVIPNIEFSPIIIKLVSILLIFCTEAETYSIMRTLLEMNYNLSETYKIRWHFRFTYNDNLKIISSVNEAIREISHKSGKEIFEFFESINFPIEKLYEDMIYGLFFDYLNFEGICRLIPFFMIEGVKSLYRLSYALIKTLKNEIFQLKSADEVIRICREKAKNISDINKLFNLAYTFKLTRYNNKYDFQPMPDRNLFKGMRNNFYLPSFSVCSYIFKENEIVKLWSLLPSNLKVKDAKMIFNTETNGYNLTSILNLTEKIESENEILFLIETTENDVFGGFMTNMFKHTNNKYDRPIQSLLIGIRPNVVIYEPKKESDDIFYCDSTCFMFGGGPEGPVIRIDNNLSKGFSDMTGTNAFNCASIISNKEGEFMVKKMEIFILG